MRCLLLPVLLALSPLVVASDYEILAYHDVRDDVMSNYDTDQFAVSTANLIAHFRWLKDAGFQPVSVQQILDAEAGIYQLPDNPVLLTFDDGLRSFYTRVYPLLKQFRYPAVVSVVSSWIEMDGAFDYAGGVRTKDDFLTWAQVREMQDSGLVEVGSHSHDLHKGIPANPQGNEQPAAVSRRYDGSTYETEGAYKRRIFDDLRTSKETIANETGKAPRVITWPYGAFNDATADLAYILGMRLSLTLEPDDSKYKGLFHRGRYLLTANPTLADLSAELVLPERPEVMRIAQVDLDYVFDPDPAQQEANLGQLLDRIKGLDISHVYLQAYADPDGDDAADAVYFPNRHLPVRADLFSRVAWQLKTRADVRVYAWMPMLGFTGGPFRDDMRVSGAGDTRIDGDHRLSPFHAEAMQLVGEIYEDLARHTRFDGLLFHDDGRLSEFEDFNDAAQSVYRERLGSEVTPELLNADPELRQRFTRLKTQTLVDLSASLEARVRPHLPALRTARNIFASALLDAEGPAYLAQDFGVFLENYDYVALLAMPSLEGAGDHDLFFAELVAKAAKRDAGLSRTVFELQTRDWSSGTIIEGERISRTMRQLQSMGARHIGYYPDDFINGHPPFDVLREGMSLAAEYGESDR